MHKLSFGTAGIPLAAKHLNTQAGIMEVRKLGLDAMELEFVRSVNISESAALLVRKAAEENNVVLTCHAPYYINLNATEKVKLAASVQRLLKAARIAWLCGAWSMAFHAAFYMGKGKEEVYNTVKQNIKNIANILKDEGNKIWLRPEITGKRTQFGDIDELLRMSSELEQVQPCVDYAHMHAREGGCNTYDEFSAVLEKTEKELGRDALQNMHMQVSGVEYTQAGEKRHLPLQDSDLNFEALVKSWKDYGIKGVVISESPNVEEDALLLKNIYERS